MSKCLECENETKNPKFCSSSCSAKFSNKNRRKKNYCLDCEKEIRKRNKYCNQKCQYKYLNRLKINDWLSGKWNGNVGIVYAQLSKTVRNYLFEQSDYKCSQCSFFGNNPISKKTILIVDHINGDYMDNSQENLRVLCPNCHSVTPTYGALNIGNSKNKRNQSNPDRTGRK